MRVTWSCSAMLAPTSATRSARAEWPASGRRPAASCTRTARDRPGEAALTGGRNPVWGSGAFAGRAGPGGWPAPPPRGRGERGGAAGCSCPPGRRRLDFAQRAVDDAHAPVGPGGDALVVGDDHQRQPAARQPTEDVEDVGGRLRVEVA